MLPQNAVRNVPTPINEPIRSYAPGSAERAELKARLASMAGERVDIPIIVGGQAIRSGRTAQVVMPFKHGHVLADVHLAAPEHVQQAIEASLRARRSGPRGRSADRAAVFLKAADLLADPWRATINAATMLGQAKTVFQAEIDAACELIDFWRFNVQLRRRSSTTSSRSARRRLEPARLPAARRLRLRGHAVQLHGDRRQSADARRR